MKQGNWNWHFFSINILHKGNLTDFPFFFGIKKRRKTWFAHGSDWGKVAKQCIQHFTLRFDMGDRRSDWQRSYLEADSPSFTLLCEMKSQFFFFFLKFRCERNRTERDMARHHFGKNVRIFGEILFGDITATK